MFFGLIDDQLVLHAVLLRFPLTILEDQIQKVGGTGHWPVPGEIEEEGEERGESSENAVVNGSSGLRAGDSGFVFGRLAGRRPATLSLWPSIEPQEGAAVRWITQSAPL
jgi:hypothetical protein